MKGFKRAVAWTAAVLLMVVIFSMSAQTAEVSSGTSGGVIRAVVSAIYPDFDSLDIAVQDEIVESYQHFARKTAHFSVYALLGVLYFAALAIDVSGKGRSFFLSAALGCLYAVSDEIHQLFVAGRSGQVSDVLLDTCGAAVGAAAALAIWFAAQRLTASRRGKKQ